MSATYDIFDLGFDKFLSKAGLIFNLLQDTESGLSSILSNVITDSVNPADLVSGEWVGNISIKNGYLQSSNFLAFTSGWRLTPTSGEFNFHVSVDYLDIPDAITFNSFHVDNIGNIWSGATTFNILTNPFAVSNAGVLRAVSGTIGGWTIGDTTLTATGIILDAGNQKIESTNYVSGVFGAGFHLDSNLLEAGNIACRGLLRTAVFQKDVISVMGGNFVVLDGDVLDEDMFPTD